MPGAATAPHGDALSMPPVSMATTRNVARVTGRRVIWDLALKMGIWGCWVSFFFFFSSFSSIFGFPSLPSLVWEAPSPTEPLGQAAAAPSRALPHLCLSCEAMAEKVGEGGFLLTKALVPYHQEDFCAFAPGGFWPRVPLHFCCRLWLRPHPDPPRRAGRPQDSSQSGPREERDSAFPEGLGDVVGLSTASHLCLSPPLPL